MARRRPGLGGRDSRPKTFLDGGSQEKTDNRSVSQRNEMRMAKKIGADLVPGSGSTPFWKGDYTDDDFMYQEKTCRGARIVIEEADIIKAYREAAMQGKRVAFTLTIRGLPDHVPCDYVMVPADTWAEGRETS